MIEALPEQAVGRSIDARKSHGRLQLTIRPLSDQDQISIPKNAPCLASYGYKNAAIDGPCFSAYGLSLHLRPFHLLSGLLSGLLRSDRRVEVRALIPTAAAKGAASVASE